MENQLPGAPPAALLPDDRQRSEEHAARGDATTRSSSVVDLRTWLERQPWRIAAGWSLLAAALASDLFGGKGAAISGAEIVLLFLLVDPLWGGIWGAFTAPATLPRFSRLSPGNRIWLPYLHPGSPAARFFGTEGPGILSLILRVALPGMLLALLAALAINTQAPWFTLLAIGLCVAGWLHLRIDLVPIEVLHACIAVALPWLLGLVSFVREPAAIDWFWQGGLVAVWTLHTWGANHQLARAGRRAGLVGIAVAHIGLGLFLLVGREPLWLALVAIILLPTWLAVYRKQSLRRVEFWWLAAMLISAAALGQKVG